MSSSVTDKKQNFFKAVISEKDREELLATVLSNQSLLQVKQDGVKVSGTHDLTIVKTSGRYSDGIIGAYVSGPRLRPSEVTVAFELAKAMFFCTGKLIEVHESKY